MDKERKLQVIRSSRRTISLEVKPDLTVVVRVPLRMQERDIHAFLREQRLRKAAQLLETTGLRISEVAEQVGIPNVSYFSTIFRKEFGCSPSDLRPKKPKDFS